MCGEGTVQNIQDKWKMYLPKILAQDLGKVQFPVRDVASEDEKNAYQALEILDKHSDHPDQDLNHLHIHHA